ncbi:hypothetical protein BH24BAC1_BH24BAC1_38210 [soil metagenome]
MKYLEPLVPVLRRLEADYDFDFQVISNRPPSFSLRSLVYRPWKKETEIPDLLQFHVGVMPLEEDPWAKGKCAFKALQYMALGIPALVSPVGMNTEVVVHGHNGYLCATEEDWFTYLQHLLSEENLRAKMGRSARTSIVARYSVKANRENFLGLFR